MEKRVLLETGAIQGLLISLPRGQDGGLTLRGDNDSTLHEVRDITAQGNELQVTVISGRWGEHIGERVSLSFRAFGNLYGCDATIARFDEDCRILALTMITEVWYVPLEAGTTIPVEPPTADRSPQASQLIVYGLGCIVLIGVGALVMIAAALWQLTVL